MKLPGGGGGKWAPPGGGGKAGERGPRAEGRWMEVGGGVAVGLAWSWRCSRWCPGRSKAPTGPRTGFRPCCCRTCCHGGWTQQVKVVVDSFAYGASVTSLEEVRKPCENTRGRSQVRTRGWQTATKRKGRMANDRSQKKQQSEQTVHQFFSWSNGIWYGSRPATPGAAARHLSAWAPHVVLVLVASPGLQDLVLIDGAQFPKSDGPKLRLSDGEVLQKLA